jgi:hypothetical protein
MRSLKIDFRSASLVEKGAAAVALGILFDAFEYGQHDTQYMSQKDLESTDAGTGLAHLRSASA